MSGAVCYLSTRKNRHHGEAIAAGFGARCVPVEQARLEPDAELHLIGGLQFGSLELLTEARAKGVPYVFFDRAYFGGGPGSDRLRVVADAYQHHLVHDWYVPKLPDRLTALGVEMKPWRGAGDHILLVPPSEAIQRLFDLGDWEAQMLARLRHCTERPVMVSHKGDPRPLSTRLHGCHAVVAWTSNVAVEAICAGVPAIVSRWSAAAPISSLLDKLEHWIEQPLMVPPKDRLRWARWLAWRQWTVAEIRQGLPARELAEAAA